MTEAEWLVYVSDPLAMIRQVRSPKDHRKIGLLVCACWMIVWNLLDKAHREQLLEVQNALHTSPNSKIQICQDALRKIAFRMGKRVWEDQNGDTPAEWTEDRARLAAVLLTASAALNSWGWGPLDEEGERTARICFESGQAVAWFLTRERQCQLCREIYGNPFRRYSAPASLPIAVVQLATAMYEGQDCSFALHDALLDMGHAELARHFQENAHHPKGCWALDLLLGKE